MLVLSKDDSDYGNLKETFELRARGVEVAIKFTHYAGRYVIHCHMLEYEDTGMMGQFQVVPP